MSTEIRVRAAQCTDLLHKGTRKVKEIKSLIEKRYNFNDEDNKVELSIKPLPYDKNLSAAAYQISTGQPKKDFIDLAVRHVELRQGILGLKV